MIKTTQYIDQITGELMHEKKSYYADSFDEEKGYLFWNRKNFVKMFSDVPFPTTMSKMDIAHMTLLVKKIWSNTNMLGYRGNGGIKPYDVDGISKIIGLQRRQTISFLNKMQSIGMIAESVVKVEDVSERHYYINPIYYFSSNRLPLNLYLLFRVQLDAVLPNDIVSKFINVSK